MIDIHSHILPGIDDGAKTVEDSLAMARQAYDQGITKIVATPHHKNGTFENERRIILAEVERLNEKLKEESIHIEVLPGQENRIYGELVEDLSGEELLTVNRNGNYMLIEFPSSHLPRYANKLLFDLQVNGIIPIIVHPERNREIMENPERLYNLVKEGALSQLTGKSVTGEMGKKIQKFSFDLIQSNLTHFIASDAHNTTNRPFDLGDAMGTVEREFGISTRYMLQENAEDMIVGKMVAKEIPEKIRRKKILGLF
ncbi:tyrosine-protein phosphatase [Pseudalkalibacillus hwajinpoensis]|uniref:Tyrosine-protein phosphatase n=1 Tax=Guptibacillus hwajinpoensis TaxID=208199 RepID=A0A4U1MJH7_9BACL|nr:CpsB/CapC family capsule biosynthesis tyrosine phosphatase [Pseudalkalibacillus hwajinpoensis]TKD70725.1 tyrosine protein phosphatase [Pseudalkalibacillus hwajinpoensis]